MTLTTQRAKVEPKTIAGREQVLQDLSVVQQLQHASSTDCSCGATATGWVGFGAGW